MKIIAVIGNIVGIGFLLFAAVRFGTGGWLERVTKRALDFCPFRETLDGQGHAERAHSPIDPAPRRQRYRAPLR